MIYLLLVCGFVGAMWIAFGSEERARGRATGMIIALLTVGTRSQYDRTGFFVLGLVALVAFVGLIKGRPPEKRGSSAVWFLVALWLTLILAEYVGGSADLSLMIRVALVSIVVAVLGRSFSENNMLSFLKSLVVVAWIQVAFACLEIFTGVPIWGYEMNRAGTGYFVQANQIVPISIPRLEAATGHSIVFGFVLVLGIVAQLLLMRRKSLGLRVLAVLPLLAFLVLSGSRSVILALLAVLIYAVLVPGSGLHWGWRLLALVVGVAGLVLGSTALSASLNEFTRTGSFTNRLESLNSLYNLSLRPPFEIIFGSGFSNADRLFDQGFIDQSTSFRVIDNLWVSLYAFGGILAVVLMIAVFLAAWWKAGATRRLLLVVFTVMSFSFDYMWWFSCAAILSVLLVAEVEEVEHPRRGIEVKSLRSRPKDRKGRDSSTLYPPGVTKFGKGSVS